MLNADVRPADVGAARRSGIQFHDVDPCARAWEAAALLRQSWAPPCLRYSDSYVTWRLAFPGAVRPRAVLATEGHRPIGFVAMMPRQVLIGDHVVVIYVLSFFAVHPDYRGAQIGTELALRIVEISDRPILTYTEPGARSERALARSAAARGWTFKRLATLRTYAGGPGRAQSAAVARQATAEEFVVAAQARGPSTIVWSQPTIEQARHYARDPRGGCFAIVQSTSGVTLGAALVVRSEVFTLAGAEDVPSLDAVHLHDHHAEALGALRAFALERSGQPIVTAPNLDTVPPEAIRLAGFRATQSAFNVAVLANPREPMTEHTTSTNLEVF
jgi:GNAT superfamily N-acetyltransferase